MSLLRYINSFEEVVGIPVLLLYFCFMFNVIKKIKDDAEAKIVEDGIKRGEGFNIRQKACETNFLALHSSELEKRRDQKD